MCGIAGIVRTDGGAVERGEIERMIACLRHRGPDGTGVWIEREVGLGHARLAIIDLEGGAQPLGNEDGRVQVTFNGEIYNHKELRRELSGHAFKTRTDTEVLVHLYEELGADLVERLRGFFAFALWDARARRLVLARDRLGKKPLFLAQQGGRFAFASEVKALLAILPERPEVDAAALDDVLALRYPESGRTGILGIESLAPGEVLVLEAGRVARRVYWQPPRPDGPGEAPLEAGADELAAELRARLDRAVAMRLESDVPLGLLLSGGIDSTAVLESLARQRSEPVRTFTVAFSREKESEAESARLAANHFGSEHEEFALSEADLLAHLERILPKLDEPLADPSFLPTALVCELARTRVTVCLTGDGGDELFGGYTRYRRALHRREPVAAVAGLSRWLSPKLPRYRMKGWKLARALDDAARSPEEAYVASLVAADARMRQALLGPRTHAALEAAGREPDQPERVLRANLGTEDGLAERMMSLDQRHYLPGLILTKTDRASMAASLELRSPFLDTDLCEWAARIPARHKLDASAGKLLVRRALEGRVPRELLERRKQGFGTPLGRWFRRELGAHTDRYLLESHLARDGWLAPRAVADLVQAHRHRMRNVGEVLWVLLVLEVWYRTWIEAARG